MVDSPRGMYAIILMLRISAHIGDENASALRAGPEHAWGSEVRLLCVCHAPRMPLQRAGLPQLCHRAG